MATIVESAPFAVLLVGKDGRILFANPGAEQLLGYSRDELSALVIEALVPVAHRARHKLLREGFFHDPGQRPMANGLALSAARKDGSEVPVEVALRPIRLVDSPCVLAIVVDVTERRRLEERIRRAHDELECRIEQRTSQLARLNAEKEDLLRDLQAKTSELERLSLEDPLTGLSNRRDFDRHLLAWTHYSHRHGSPLTVAMFDIDRFKLVNDKFGHARGDEVLKATAKLMREECRGVDVVARYGGEEFALILPGVDIRNAHEICERIRNRFRSYDWNHVVPGSALTISAGVADWSPGAAPPSLLAAADMRLYRAKRSGRDRVISDDAGDVPDAGAAGD